MRIRNIYQVFLLSSFLLFIVYPLVFQNRRKNDLEEIKINNIKDIVADSIEALIGAIYYDKGFDIAEKFILNNWKNFINSSKEIIIDSKTELQEYSLKKFKSLPIYKLVSSSGPRHKPKFIISVKLKDTKMYDGHGESKKKAEQNAAKKLLDNIK